MVAGLVVIGLLTREAIQVFESNPVDKHAPSEKAAVPYLTYGPHTFKQGEENLYNRLGADYFYPAHNGETLVFHFRSVADPSSQWDYKVTRRKDGTIHLEDDCVFNAHDSRLKGDHMVTLTSGDADIMYDNKPLPQ